VIASELEKPVIEGKMPIPRRPSGLRPPNTTLKPTPVDRVVKDGDVLSEVMGGLRVVFTPGHAPGHLAFWQPTRRILFCGDVIIHAGGLRLPMALATVDMAEDKRSIKRLAELDASIVCFGHGGPLTRQAAQAIRDFARRVGAL